MAETVSSIITIAGLGLAIIEATIAYIKKVQLVDKIVERLLVKFKDLHRLIKLVEGIYRQGEAQEESKQAKLIRKNLVGCRDRLRNIHSMLYDLASKESTSFFQKVVLKRGVDKVKSDIDLAINDIQDYMKNIGMFISLDVLSIQRRLSETVAAQQVTTISQIVEQIPHVSLTPTVSDDDTLLTYIPSDPTRRPSQPLQIPSTNSTSSCVDFHFQLAKCDGDKEQIDQIRKFLQQNPAFTRSTDTSHRTPLHIAAQHGDIQLARILLEFGADIDAHDSEPSTILDTAVEKNQRKFVELLLARNVDTTALQPRNRAKFAEIKGVIDYQNGLPKQAPKKNSRKVK